MTQHNNSDVTLIRSLVGKLSQAQRVIVLARASSVDDIATEAAVGLVDIKNSCELMFGSLLPKLADAQPDQIEAVLDEIAEEYRHIYYHIANTRLFNYVVPEP